jgi:hypothetical protein
MAKILRRTLAVCFSIAMPATISQANTILATLCWRLALEAALPNSLHNGDLLIHPVSSPEALLQVCVFINYFA